MEASQNNQQVYTEKEHLETSKRIVLGVGIYAGIFLIVALVLMCYSVASATYIKDLSLAMITFVGTIFIGYMSKAFLENVNKYQKGNAVDMFNNSMKTIATKSIIGQQQEYSSISSEGYSSDQQETCG